MCGLVLPNGGHDGIGDLFDQTPYCSGKARSMHGTIAKMFHAKNVVHMLRATQGTLGLQKIPVAYDAQNNLLGTTLLLGLVWVWKLALLRALCPIHLTLLFFPQVG